MSIPRFLALGGFSLILVVGGSNAAPLPRRHFDKMAWGPVRSLGKMGKWHSLTAISPDGKLLLLGGSKGLEVYDLAKGKVVHQVRTRESVQDASFSPDGKLVAVAEWRDGVKLRDAATMQVIQTLTGTSKLAAWQARFSPDGQRLICYSWWGNDKQLWSHDLQAQKEIGWPGRQNADTPTSMMRESLRGWGQHLFSVERTPDNGRYKAFRVWVTDPATGKTSPKVELGNKDYFQFDLSPDGSQAIVMEPGEDPRIIELKTGKTIQWLNGHKRWVSGAAFSKDGKLIATASGTSRDGHALVYRNTSNDGPTELILRESGTGKVIVRTADKDKSRDYWRIGFSPDGRYVYTITVDQELLLWGNFPVVPPGADPLPN